MPSSEAPRRGPLPPVLFLASLVVQAALHLLVPLAQLVVGGWRLVAVLPIVGGFALAAAAETRFKAEATAVNPYGEPSTLVTTGPFRYSRNPMYLGMLLIQGGVALALGSVMPWIVVPLFAWMLNERFIRMEEKKMEGTFGAAYVVYRGTVRRWL